MSKHGPFGLWQGMTLDDLGAAQANPTEINPGQYQLDSVPKPHSLFESYMVQIAPTIGLSWIQATSKEVPTSTFGVELKEAFINLESRLEKTYGPYERTDMLLPDSIWNEPREWMQSLLNRQRYLKTQWSNSTGAKLPNSLNSVALICSANDTDSGLMLLEYTFDNKDEADAEISSIEDEVL